LSPIFIGLRQSGSLNLRTRLEDLHALGIENVFAITGDYPKAGASGSAEFDLDSVNWWEMIGELRRSGLRFHFGRGVAIQVHGGRLRLSVPQARGKLCRSGLCDHSTGV
jgi:5,10-methylenetetrahydrofolate reductase